MKTNSKREVIVRIAGPGLVLAALLAMVLSSSSAGRAQSAATSPAVPAAALAKVAPAAQAVQSAVTVKRQSGGTHEGITVHGHWTIEVKNPDGKLVSHTEFENALQPTGADELTGLVSGEYVSGGFMVSFSTSATPALNLNTGGPGLCLEGICTLYDSRGYYAGQDCETDVACVLLTYTPNPSSVVGFTSIAAGFTLSGTVTNISSGGLIQSVASGLAYCAASPGGGALNPKAFLAITPQQCGTTNSVVTNQYILTGANLPLPASGQCGGAGQPECAVTVTAGQSVSVSVQITFGSGATAAPANASLPAAKSAK